MLSASPLVLSLCLTLGQAKPEPAAGLEPTPEETLILEYINRFRANPPAEADRILSEGVKKVPLEKALKVDLAMMSKEIKELPAVPPVFFHPNLLKSARNHAQYMILNNKQTHEEEKDAKGFTGVTVGERIKEAGYPATTGGECAFLGVKDPYYTFLGYVVDWGPGPGGMQPGRGHRMILSSPKFREFGVAHVKYPGGFSNIINAGNRRAPGRLVGGVAYVDRNRNGFYDVGEGIGGVTVTASDGATTSTWKSGAYSLLIGSDKPLTFTFSHGGSQAQKDLPKGTDNFKIDWAVPDAELLAGVQQLIDKVEKIADKESPVYRNAVINLYLKCNGLDVEGDVKKKIDSLVADVGKEVDAAQAEVRKGMELDNPKEFAKLIQAAAKPFKDTELAGWFNDAGQIYAARSHIKRFEDAKDKLAPQVRLQAEAQIAAGLDGLRQKLRTPEFLREVETLMTQYKLPRSPK